jgi:uncharacterized membrane protein (Fun14 family)
MSWFKRWTDTDSEVDVQNVFSDLSKGSIAKQLTVGVLTGLCSGFVFSHVGKAAAMGVGGGLLILQIAESLGWISINWGKVDNTVEKAKERLAKSDKDKAILKIKVFVRDNIFIVGGFVSGFFIGIAI